LEINHCILHGGISTLGLHFSLAATSDLDTSTITNPFQVAETIYTHLQIGGFSSIVGTQGRIFYDTSSSYAKDIVTYLLNLAASSEADYDSEVIIPTGHTSYSWKAPPVRAWQRQMIGNTAYSVTENMETSSKSPPPIILPVPVASLHKGRIISILATFYPVKTG